MSRDLFATSLHVRPRPKRSHWTIVGSVLAHAAILGALLVIPVLSALDNYVLHADDALTFVMPATPIPADPPPPRSAAPASAAQPNPNVAPANAPEHPVTNEVPVPPGGGASGTAPGPWSPNVGSAGLPGQIGGTGVQLTAPPVPPVPRRPGGDLKPPARTVYVAPIYPPLARATHVEGSVILEATIDEAGIVRNVHVLRSIPLLDRAAIDAVSQWRYAPTRLNGTAVPILLTVTVAFSMK
jgi:protein TonB